MPFKTARAGALKMSFVRREVTKEILFIRVLTHWNSSHMTISNLNLKKKKSTPVHQNLHRIILLNPDKTDVNVCFLLRGIFSSTEKSLPESQISLKLRAHGCSLNLGIDVFEVCLVLYQHGCGKLHDHCWNTKSRCLKELWQFVHIGLFLFLA